MKLNKKEWLIFGTYCNIDAHTGEVIIGTLKFKFNNDAQKNLYNLMKILDYIDEKGYNLNAKIESYFSKINLTFNISLTEKYIIKDIYITSLVIN